MLKALRTHWPEYLIEAAGLGFFMVSACAFGVLLFHPSSPVVAALPDTVPRRVLMGAAMGATAVAIIYSPWGKRSGAHVNPATTLTFYRLGKVKGWDALFYVAAQFAGGVAGTLMAVMLLGEAVKVPEVNYVVTRGEYGAGVAFAAEVVITFLLMTVVLNAANSPRLSRWTGLFAGALVLTYISIEQPLSGMSMNPARGSGRRSGSTSPRPSRGCSPPPNSTGARAGGGASTAPSTTTATNSAASSTASSTGSTPGDNRPRSEVGAWTPATADP